MSSTDSGIEDAEGQDIDSTHNGMKFLVFFPCLLPLLRHCFECNADTVITKIFTMGTALCVKLQCASKHISTWYSQPMIRNTFLGNLHVASSIVFSGGTCKLFRDMVDSMCLQMQI